MAKKQIQKVVKPDVRYTAYADFELEGVEYEAGMEFVPPAQYTRDLKAEELRNLDRPKGSAGGLVFQKVIPILAKGEKVDEEIKRVILPLKEA